MTTENNEIFARPNTEAKIYDLQQYSLYAPSPSSNGKRAMMKFGERNGAPRITVIPNTGQLPKVITAGFSPEIFERFLSEFEQVINSTDKSLKIGIDNLQKDPTFEGRAPDFDSVPKVVKNTLYFGKDEEGICFLSMEQHGADRIVFRILPSVWHVFRYSDGRELTKADASARAALSLIHSLRASLARYTSRLGVPFVPEGGGKPKFADGTRPADGDSLGFF